MANIQTLAVPNVMQAAVPGAKLDASALMAPSRATMMGGSAMKEVGDVLGQLSLRMAAVKNLKAEREAERMMDDEFARHQIDMAKEPDPTKWDEMWQKRSDNASRAILERDMALAVRDRLDIKVSDWKAQTGIRVKTQAVQQEIKLDTEIIVDAAKRKAAAGRGEEAAIDILELETKGLAHPQQVKHLQEVLRQDGDVARAKGEIGVDAIGAVEKLEQDIATGEGAKHFPHLDPLQRNQLLREAKGMADDIRHMNVQTFVQRIDGGTNPVSADELDRAVEEKQILPTQAVWLKNQARLGGPEDEQQEMLDILEDIRLNYKSGVFNETYNSNTHRTELALRIGRLSTLNARFAMADLEDKDNPKDPKSAPKEDTIIRGSMERAFARGDFGNTQRWTETEIKNAKRNPKGYKITKEQAANLQVGGYKFPEQAAKASRTYINTLSELRDKVAAGELRTLAEQNDWIMQRTDNKVVLDYADTLSSWVGADVSAATGTP